MSGISKFLFGKKPSVKQIPRFSPEQQSFIENLLSQLQGPAQAGVGNLQQILSGEPEAFEAFEAPALRQFQQEIVPGIAERFTSQFGPGAGRSSAFGQALGQAGSELSERLAGQRAGLQSGALSQLQSLLGTGLQQTTQPALQPGTSGLLGPILGGIGSGVGQFGGQALGGGLLGLLSGQGFRGGIQSLLGV